jgi:hypothetical protein
MKIRTLGPAFVALTLLTTPVRAQDAAPTASNAEMTRIYDEDQADRNGDLTQADWGKIIPRDEQRRAATRALLQAGALHTGVDFNHAAFVFQHGSTANDYLLAHTLAMVAVGKGDRSSLWIASATLDRYLVMVNQPQVYGTQYMSSKGGPYGQEPYNRDLISDALRGELGVPSLAKQNERLEQMRALQAQQHAKP